MADLSFFAQLAEVVPDAVKVYLLLRGETQIGTSINLKNYQESEIFRRKEKKNKGLKHGGSSQGAALLT